MLQNEPFVLRLCDLVIVPRDCAGVDAPTTAGLETGATSQDEARILLFAPRPVTARLDTQEAARFLSYPGILLESWRGWHREGGANFAAGLADSEGRLCRTGSRRR